MFDLLCPRHGGLSHVFVHECSHAVVAVQRQIRFTEVRILPPAEWVAIHRDSHMAGGVWLVESDPTAWVPNDPAGALEFALAGSMAEQVYYGHHLNGSHEGDFNIWRRGVGLVDSTAPDEINAALDRPFHDVIAATRASVIDNQAAIRRLMTALAKIEDDARLATLSYDEAWVLTEAEVIELVG